MYSAERVIKLHWRLSSKVKTYFSSGYIWITSRRSLTKERLAKAGIYALIIRKFDFFYSQSLAQGVKVLRNSIGKSTMPSRSESKRRYSISKLTWLHGRLSTLLRANESGCQNQCSHSRLIFSSLWVWGIMSRVGDLLYLWIKKPLVMHDYLPWFTTPVYFDQCEVVFVMIESNRLETDDG